MSVPAAACASAAGFEAASGQVTESAPPACGPLYKERQRYWERGLGRGWQVHGRDLTCPPAVAFLSDGVRTPACRY